jgi:hypothetical protein
MEKAPLAANNYGLLSARPLPIFNFEPLPAVPKGADSTEEELLSARTLTELSTSDLRELTVPKQPLPALVEIPRTAPMAPTNLRIIR